MAFWATLAAGFAIALAAFSSVAMAATLTLWATGLTLATAAFTAFLAFLASFATTFLTAAAFFSAFLTAFLLAALASSIVSLTAALTLLNFLLNFLATNLLTIAISSPIFSASCPKCLTVSMIFSVKLCSNCFAAAFLATFFCTLGFLVFILYIFLFVNG
ncbi:hypothetical protein D3C86_1725990 [compost metagenome]